MAIYQQRLKEFLIQCEAITRIGYRISKQLDFTSICISLYRIPTYNHITVYVCLLCLYGLNMYTQSLHYWVSTIYGRIGEYVKVECRISSYSFRGNYSSFLEVGVGQVYKGGKLFLILKILILITKSESTLWKGCVILANEGLSQY